MGLSCYEFGAFFNLLLLRGLRQPSTIACHALRRFWNRHFSRKRFAKPLKPRFCYDMKSQEEVECSIHEEGRSLKKQKKEVLFFRHRKKSAPRTSLSGRRTFGRVASWSRYVEESVGSEIVSLEFAETEYSVDMSQLFLGQKFASGAHSRLYHGIYQNRPVAVKLMMPLHEDSQLSSQLNRQFSLEVSLLSRLRHNNIIEFVGACKRPPIYCVITEYLSGGSLKVFLHKNNPNSISMDLITRLALDVAEGMKYLHSQGVIHRDLKSDNLLMTDDFHVKVADFGVSCLETQRNSMKGFLGTYRWMAPEMIKEEICSRKVDVYSFGMVLWELCTGLIPFGDMTPVQAAFAICQEKARPTIPDHCPKELARLMQQCWSSNPAKRPEFIQIVELLQILNIQSHM